MARRPRDLRAPSRWRACAWHSQRAPRQQPGLRNSSLPKFYVETQLRDESTPPWAPGRFAAVSPGRLWVAMRACALALRPTGSLLRITCARPVGLSREVVTKSYTAPATDIEDVQADQRG
jgi:hypothetical protein